jgi:hypothetical protein
MFVTFGLVVESIKGLRGASLGSSIQQHNLLHPYGSICVGRNVRCQTYVHVGCGKMFGNKHCLSFKSKLAINVEKNG